MGGHFSNVVEVVASFVGILAFIGAVIFKPLRRLLRNIGEFLDDWRGEPARAGVPGRLGVMARFETLEANQIQLSKDRAEVKAALVKAEREAQHTRDVIKRALLESGAQTTATLTDIDGRLADVQAKTDVVHSELTPNGGGSMKDQLTRADKALSPRTAKAERDEED